MNMLPTESWNPDRRWADPFIATLILVILLLVTTQAQVRRQGQVQAPAQQVSLQGRLQDLALAAPKLLGPLGGSPMAPRSIAAAATEVGPGWDQALMAIHAGEAGQRDLGRSLAQAAPGPLGERFRAAWERCYLGTGTVPEATDRARLRAALGNGYGARILEARLQALAGGDGRAWEAAAQDWARPRLLALGAATAGGFLLALAGLGFALYLGLSQARPAALPRYGLSGRAILIVLLGWFLTLMAAGPTVGILVALFPILKPIGLPLVYGLHAALGTCYLCKAEGVGLRALWRRLLPGHCGRALASGLGFLALAFTAVMAMGLVLAPLMRNQSPQKELLDLLARLQGPAVLVVVFLTVAVLAPAFEEMLFRGFLLPWLGERLERQLGRRKGWLLALAITALTFGAMHMQPWGLPTLSTLGFVLGLAYVRTGNLLTAILVHGLWNGGVFIAMRLLTA